MICLLGIIPVLIGIGLAISAISAGFSIYQYVDTKKRIADQEAKQEAQIAKNKNRTKAQAVEQYNLALASMQTGEVMGRREEILAQREQNYNDDHYGQPEIADENFRGIA